MLKKRNQYSCRITKCDYLSTTNAVARPDAKDVRTWHQQVLRSITILTFLDGRRGKEIIHIQNQSTRSEVMGPLGAYSILGQK